MAVNLLCEISLVCLVELKDDGLSKGQIYAGILCSDGSVEVETAESGIVRLNPDEFKQL